MVYLFLADGFEEIEALTPVDMLRRAGVEVVTVSINETEKVTGAHGITVIADVLVNDVQPADVDMVILPGGLPGVDNLRNCPKVIEFIDVADKKGAFIAAICAAPRIIGEKGLLKGKKVTCYPGFEQYLLGADCTADGCVRDGNIITAKGMGKSCEFARCLIEALKDKETADKIKNAVFA